MSVAVLVAPAKLTVSLRVTGLRGDGFHLIEAEMVSVGLFDTLVISDGSGLVVTDEVGWNGPPDGGVGMAAGGRNLVETALQRLGLEASVKLTKRIPAAAGLGGGSSDAAAVLRWARCSDPEVAVSIGADVPFSVLGGRALVRGVGELVEPLAYEEADYLLVVPRLAVTTPSVYAAWDALGGPVGEAGNDLEPAALVVEPTLVWWRQLVEDATGRRPRLAGSGGTWWLTGPREELVEAARRVGDAMRGAGQAGLVHVVGAVPPV